MLRLDPVIRGFAEVQATDVVLESAPVPASEAVLPLPLVGPEGGDPRHVEVVGRVGRVEDSRGAWRGQGGVLPQGITVFPIDAEDKKS